VPVFSNKWTLFLLAILAGVLIWNQFRDREQPSDQVKQQPLPKVATPPQAAPQAMPDPPSAADIAMPNEISPAASSSALVLPGSAAAIPATPDEDFDISEDLNAVDAAIRDYQAVHGENPIGSNAEISTALFVNNPGQIKLNVPAGSHLNAAGELCDRWGTPYFFHQVSATEMEIRSAGPDRKMWTGDDSQM
jgi:hypothetical protein